MTIEITRPEIELLIQERLQCSGSEPAPAFDKQRAMAAGGRIRELSKVLTLGGLTIRDLMNEGRP